MPCKPIIHHCCVLRYQSKAGFSLDVNRAMSPRPTSIDTQAAEGFSAKRGIQQQQHHQRQQHHHHQQHQQEQQKTAVGWGEGTVMGLLRRSIMDRCPAQGLDLIQVSFDGTSTQKVRTGTDDFTKLCATKG